jgi:hypothetical protein
MMRRPGHVVNSGLAPTRTPLPVVAGTDFAASVTNVVAWGGQAWLYSRAVVAGLHAAGAEVDRGLALAVGSLAGWRSGVLDLRADALGRLAQLVDSGRVDVVGAVLGVPPEAVRPFAALQEQHPLAWPLLAPAAVVARVGGFAGLGGVWSAPPRAVGRTASGDLRVRCADAGVWGLEVDVFGHRLTPVEGRVDGPVGDDGGVVGASVGARSYLVELTGELA